MHTPNPQDLFFNPIQYWTDVYKMQIEMAEMTLAMAAVANPVLARAVIRRVPGTRREPAPAQRAEPKTPSAGKPKAERKVSRPRVAAPKPGANTSAKPASKPRSAPKAAPAAKPATKTAPSAETATKRTTAKKPMAAPSKPKRAKAATPPAVKAEQASKDTAEPTTNRRKGVTLAPDLPPSKG